ncbi:hypothetical protein CDAR_517881 [Caerostris darwini]|uniref:Uncharacterized protein n=1 Tax=Caerostris darwini TaxID=1538125 RepID=A0AAV4PZV7_9ARAC|nr:hypothetical protein CDAR_517881 [Caerostris darwini]
MSRQTNPSTRTRGSGSSSSQSEEINQPPSSQQDYSRPSMWPDLDFSINPSLENFNVLSSPVHVSSSSSDVHMVDEVIWSTFETFLETHPAETSLTPSMLEPEFDFSPVLSGVDINACPAPINMESMESAPYWNTSSFETQNTESSESARMSSLQVKESTVVLGDGQLPSSNLNFDQSALYWNASSFETQNTESSESARISSLQVKESTGVRGDSQLPSSNMNFDQNALYWNTSSFETENTESSDINITDSRRRQEIQQTLLTRNEGAKFRSSKSTALQQTLLTGNEGAKSRSSKSTVLQQTLLIGNEGAKSRSSKSTALQQTLLTGNEGAKSRSSKSTALQQTLLTGNEGAKFRSSKSTALQQTLLTGNEGAKSRSSKSTALQQTLLTGNEGAKFRSSKSAALQRNVKRKDTSSASGTHSGMNQTVKGNKRWPRSFSCAMCVENNL